MRLIAGRGKSSDDAYPSRSPLLSRAGEAAADSSSVSVNGASGAPFAQVAAPGRSVRIQSRPRQERVMLSCSTVPRPCDHPVVELLDRHAEECDQGGHPRKVRFLVRVDVDGVSSIAIEIAGLAAIVILVPISFRLHEAYFLRPGRAALNSAVVLLLVEGPRCSARPMAHRPCRRCWVQPGSPRAGSSKSSYSACSWEKSRLVKLLGCDRMVSLKRLRAYSSPSPFPVFLENLTERDNLRVHEALQSLDVVTASEELGFVLCKPPPPLEGHLISGGIGASEDQHADLGRKVFYP